ncbi:MAG: L-2-hydroxyglutarate oxidase [Gammaproteobacteria bacterium]|nr:L-2-hydroxyglutarate oxidase [Gammaproteobacteria bacterium]
MDHDHEFVIIGAGIVGAATALELIRRRPKARIRVIEKESSPASHQSGHNSGVVHAGVYYEPGSLKARFCRAGVEATRAFCREHAVPYRTTGKLIVATTPAECNRLDALLERCRANDLEPRLLDGPAIRSLEPEVTGLAAILVQESAITDYPAITRAMLEEFRRRGGEARLGTEVTGIEERSDGVRLSLGGRSLETGRLIVCGGLQADRLARLQGLDIPFRTVPFRGEYFRLRPERSNLVAHLVYPVPDPSLPFLGVHLTPQIDGSITVGPNAVQGWKREGYEKYSFSLPDTAEMLRYPGWWKLAGRNLGAGIREGWNSAWKRGYLKQVRKYCPGLELEDLLPHPAGVRAQAVDHDGRMIHDFLLERSPRTLHVGNAPSPAATSAIPISRHICSVALEDSDRGQA